MLDLGMNGLSVAGALFFAGTLILLRTVTAEGVWQISDENIAGHNAVSTNSRGLTAPSQPPHQFVVESINIGHQSFRTYFLPKFYAARLELLDSPFEIFNIVFDQVAQPPLEEILSRNQDKKTAASVRVPIPCGASHD